MMRGVAQRTDKWALSVSGVGMVYPVTHMILHGLPCPSFSLITVRSHTLSNSQCSDSKQHPSYGHNASLWEGGKWLLKPISKANNPNIQSEYGGYIWWCDEKLYKCGKETQTSLLRDRRKWNRLICPTLHPRMCKAWKLLKVAVYWTQSFSPTLPPVYIRSIKLFSQRFA